MPRWNRYGRVGLLCMLAFSVAGCYSYPYSPYAPYGPGTAPGAAPYNQPAGPAFPSGNGTYAPQGTSFIPPSGPAAFGGYPSNTTSLPTPVPGNNNGYESVPPRSGNNEDKLVPTPDDLDDSNLNDNSNDPFYNDSTSSTGTTGGSSLNDPFSQAIARVSSNPSIAKENSVRRDR